MSVAQRQLRVRVLEALDQRTKQFRTRPELWPLRVPAEPLRLDDIVQDALGEEARTFDQKTLRARTLLPPYPVARIPATLQLSGIRVSAPHRS